MTLADFIKINKGKKVDFDKAYGAQCVDLFRQYAKDVLGIEEHTGPCQTTGGAKDLFCDYDKMPGEKKYFNKYTHNRNTVYKTGDVVIWNKTDKNPYGHVAIFINVVDKDNFIVFEQDGFAQAGAVLNIHAKTNLLGCLRKK